MKKTPDLLLKEYYNLKSALPKGEEICPLGIAQLVNHKIKYSLNGILSESFLTIRGMTKLKQGINDIVNANLTAYQMNNKKSPSEVIQDFEELKKYFNEGIGNKLSESDKRFLVSNSLLYQIPWKERKEIYSEIKDKFEFSGNIIPEIITIGNYHKKIEIEQMRDNYDKYFKKRLSERIDQASRARLSTIDANNVNIVNAYKILKMKSSENKIPRNARAILLEGMF